MASFCMRAVLSRTLIMSKPSTVESLFGARRGHHGGMRMAWVSVGRDHQQQELVAVERDNFEGVYRLTSVSIESYVAPAGREFSGHFCPLAEVVNHAIDDAEPTGPQAGRAAPS
jgi:hypothetical protein